MLKIRTMVMLLAWLTLAACAPARAADPAYPIGPIRLVVAFPPGSTTDTIARQLGQRLAVQLNTPVVVDNKLGAAGNIGNDFVAKSKPDGLTLLFNTSGITLSPALGEKLTFDPFKDLIPVGFVASVPLSLMVNPTVPAMSVDEFMRYLHENPDKLAYGSGGVGNITHLAPLLLLRASKSSAVHVPYRGVPPVIMDVIAGRLQFAMVSMLGRDDRVRVLATTGNARSTLYPEVPTLAESVLPKFEASSWFGVMAPAGTPSAIVKRLNEDIAKALQDPAMRKALEPQGIQLGPAMSVDEYGAYLRAEAKRWAEVITAAGVKVE